MQPSAQLLYSLQHRSAAVLSGLVKTPFSETQMDADPYRCFPQAAHLRASSMSLLTAAMAHGIVAPDFALRAWANRPPYVCAVAGLAADAFGAH